MKGMRTIKKIAVVALSLTMLMATGEVLANTDAGKNIKNWYDISLQKEADQVALDSSTKMLSAFYGLKQFIQKETFQGGNDISIFGFHLKDQSENDIHNLQSDYLETVETTVSEIENEKLTDFEKKNDEKKEMEVNEVEDEVEAILSEVLSQ